MKRRIYPHRDHYGEWLDAQPTQVIFCEEDDTTDPQGGIIYRGEIICGCCGGIFPVDGVEWFEPMKWINISEEIIGE